MEQELGSGAIEFAKIPLDDIPNDERLDVLVLVPQ
jgi:hypothetical protein